MASNQPAREALQAPGAFCSSPCSECHIPRLGNPTDLGAVLTVDEVLLTEPVATVREADIDTLYNLAIAHSNFPEFPEGDAPSEITVVVGAIDRIRRNECPNYTLS